MHSAPSVSYPVGRSRSAQGLLGSLWLLGAAAAAALCLQSDTIGWRQAAILACVAAAGAGATAGLRRDTGTGTGTGTAQLSCDGGGWALVAGRRAFRSARARVALDFQFLLLVRLEQDGRGRWLWLDRRLAPSRWSDLRRALHARAAASAADFREDAAPLRHHPGS